MNFFRQDRSVGDFFRRNSSAIRVAVAIFGLSYTVGFLLLGERSHQAAVSAGEGLAIKTSTVDIFLNNATIAVGMSFPFIANSILLLLVNGLVMSGITLVAVRSGDIGLLIAGLLPHGIFEFPAMWLASAAGLRIPLDIVTYLYRSDQDPPGRIALVDSAILLVVSIALLAIAAVIETTITPRVINVVENMDYG